VRWSRVRRSVAVVWCPVLRQQIVAVVTSLTSLTSLPDYIPTLRFLFTYTITSWNKYSVVKMRRKLFSSSTRSSYDLRRELYQLSFLARCTNIPKSVEAAGFAQDSIKGFYSASRLRYIWKKDSKRKRGKEKDKGKERG